jgi:hypothetical protein
VREWFEDESYNSEYDVVEKKYKELVAGFKLVDNRIRKHLHRDREVEAFDANLNRTYTKAKNLAAKQPWTEDYFQANFTIEYLEVQQWLEENKSLQEKKALYEVKLILIVRIQFIREKW